MCVFAPSELDENIYGLWQEEGVFIRDRTRNPSPAYYGPGGDEAVRRADRMHMDQSVADSIVPYFKVLQRSPHNIAALLEQMSAEIISPRRNPSLPLTAVQLLIFNVVSCSTKTAKTWILDS